MEDGSDYRRWDELIPDALSLIFRNLSLQEILMVVPLVCQSWGRVVSGPYCWQEIDIEDWSRRCQPDQLDRMLLMLISRSGGSLRKLNVSGVQRDTTFSFIAENSCSLRTLSMPRSDVSDSIVEQLAGKLSTITFLDVSYCRKMGAPALEAIGRNCKSLAGLCRNMHPLDTADSITQDAEAIAIATTMPKLRHLEMAYHVISSESVLQIISSCNELKFLDLRGCWYVKMDDKVKEKFPDLQILGPLVTDYYEQNDWDDGFSEYSDASDYWAWEFAAGEMGDYEDDDDSFDEMWDDEPRLEELELRFYDRLNDTGLYDWPPSP